MSSSRNILQTKEQYKLSTEDIRSTLKVGLGWDMSYTGEDLDLDASCVAVWNDGSHETVYYHRLQNANRSIWHSGDNLTGAGDGDDEEIFVELHRVPRDVKQLVFSVNIFGADERVQSFAEVSNAYIRMVDGQGQELVRFPLQRNLGKQTFVTFAMLERDGSGWSMKALGQGHGQVQSLAEASLFKHVGRLEGLETLRTFLFIFSWVMGTGVSIAIFGDTPGSDAGFYFGLFCGFCVAMLVSAMYSMTVVNGWTRKVENLHQEQGRWIAETVIQRLPNGR
ncbi:MAG: TerD family protein [Deltaproteobacteria bacterium]|nr:MAG: TerD family protein [Deltaproteobacteria bacterium]